MWNSGGGGEKKLLWFMIYSTGNKSSHFVFPFCLFVGRLVGWSVGRSVCQLYFLQILFLSHSKSVKVNLKGFGLVLLPCDSATPSFH